MSIQPIPQDVIAQIKSSAAIVSLNGVVCELMKNSLDASATRIDISLDYSRGDCVIEDDGLGIPPADFLDSGGLGKLYHTSKSNQQRTVHGNHGTFLASLSSMALTTITSHHHLHRSQNTLRMHRSEVVLRQTPAPAQHHLTSSAHGTKVTVRNLFGNMPVRVKQRALAGEKHRGYSKDWEELKSNVTLLLLAWPEKVSLNIKTSEAPQKIVFRPLYDMATFTDGDRISSSAVRSILSQAGYISPRQKASWVSVSASTANLRVDGSISLDPCATRNLQFISFDIVPVFGAGRETVLHEEINRLFSNSNFGNDDEAVDVSEIGSHRRSMDKRLNESAFTKRELAGGRKGVERWPMFYINVHRSNKSQHFDSERFNAVIYEKTNSLGPILELLRTIVFAFLSKHQFRPRALREDSPISKREAIVDQNDETSEQLGLISNSVCSKPLLRKMAGSVQVQDTPSVHDLRPIISQTGDEHIDHLGTRPKLPSFRRSLPLIETPFDTWSRIKSGSARTALEKRNDPKLSSPATSARPRSDSPIFYDIDLKQKSVPSSLASSARSTPSLLSKNGKLIRPPFKEAMAQQSLSKQPSPGKQGQGQTEVGDERSVWVNPATKVRSLLDSRTGLTVPENLCRTGLVANPSSVAGSSQLISRPKLGKIASHTLEAPGPWISQVLKDWKNPVFQARELPIPQLSFESCGDLGDLLSNHQHFHCNQNHINVDSTRSSAALSERISKDALESAEVVSQIDKKFILLKVESSSRPMGSECRSLLVIVDQHAADERIRIECLMEELCAPSTDPNMGIQSILLGRPITFEIPICEVDVLRTHTCHFARWGIMYSVTDSGATEVSASTDATDSSHHLVVRSLPPGITERCKLDPKVLIELIRSEAWKVNMAGSGSPKSGSDTRPHLTWLDQIHDCPQGILDLLNSRACRSAIMFNDELSRSQCETLVSKLAACKFPFQCAHGRPSMVPLVDLGRGTEAAADVGSSSVSKSAGFGTRFRQWKANLWHVGDDSSIAKCRGWRESAV